MKLMDYRAGPQFRLKRRLDIGRVFEQGRKVGNSMLTLIAVPNELTYSRLGVGVSARHGSAVRRNRVKRLCREAFRLTRHELPTGWDIMMLPRAGPRLTVESLQQSLRTLAAKLSAQEQARE